MTVTYPYTFETHIPVGEEICAIECMFKHKGGPWPMNSDVNTVNSIHLSLRDGQYLNITVDNEKAFWLHNWTETTVAAMIHTYHCFTELTSALKRST